MTDTEQTEHRYTYPHDDQEKDCPVGTYSLDRYGNTIRRTAEGWEFYCGPGGSPEPAGSHSHRAARSPESDATLVIRAIGWGALWFTWGFSIATFFSQGFPGPILVGIAVASVAVLFIAAGHRRRQR